MIVPFIISRDSFLASVFFLLHFDVVSYKIL